MCDEGEGDEDESRRRGVQSAATTSAGAAACSQTECHAKASGTTPSAKTGTEHGTLSTSAVGTPTEVHRSLAGPRWQTRRT